MEDSSTPRSSPVLDIVRRHLGGEPVGITSVCSAHPMVLEATFAHARRADLPFALVEATSNQVNQFGGYTGMAPKDFAAFALDLADRAGFPRDRVLLGGDHLGPNAWQDKPADEAMALAETMIADYVAAGFGKIHLDCSMSCAGDPVPLPDEAVARRAARLCAVAERAAAEAGLPPPVYVVGTEVPVPGGAHETLDTLAVTAPDAARETLAVHRRVFDEEGVGNAWPRVIALVVQPGVEFDHDKVVVYDPPAAAALREVAPAEGLVFEAHSTDYQPAPALAALVRDHFAILKVGPGVTFALREALWALDALEREWLGEDRASGLRATALQVMRDEPKYWRSYYHGDERAIAIALQYSLSDRIRYYWPQPPIVTAVDAMIANLQRDPPPAPMVSQHLPLAFARLRDRGEALTPTNLIHEHIAAVLDDYSRACNGKVAQ